MPASNVHLELTKEFNAGRLRAVICGGQAVVLHRLAVMSNDGDWILREEEEALQHVLGVLARRGARYRFGAPLALEWMRGGWSSHFEFRSGDARVRTGFVTRPRCMSATSLARIWSDQNGRDPPFVQPRELAEMKRTNRGMEYVTIDELARLMEEPRDRLLYSRSARDLMQLACRNPELARELVVHRPVLQHAFGSRRQFEQELDAEQRALIRDYEVQLDAEANTSRRWTAAWADLERRTASLDLVAAHHEVVDAARTLLPMEVQAEGTTGECGRRDEFLSEEDLDLKNLTWDELIAYWNAWLLQAQATNDLDEEEYSHGVFMLYPEWKRRQREHPEG